jgi:hypothetical protein
LTICRRSSETEPQALGKRANSNVLHILPLTPFRTIDLGGKRIFGPLFSGFCAKMRVCFGVDSAPEYVQKKSGLGQPHSTD